MSAVRARHVLRRRAAPAADVAAYVGSDAGAAVQDLHGARRRAHPQLLVDQRVRRRVQVVIELDVVVDVEPDLLPRRRLEGLLGQRRECGSVEPLEQLATARLIRAHHAVVEVRGQLGQPRVERANALELLVADAGEQPALGDLHADLDLRLVPRRHRSRGEDRRPVVPPQLRGRALDRGVVAARGGHGALELVGDDGASHATDERERAGHARHEVDDLLRARRLRVGEVARAEHRDEQLHLDDLARLRVEDLRPHPRVVDEQLVAGEVHLPHHGRLTLGPFAVPIAERAVAQPPRVKLDELHVQERQRHPLPSQLQVQRRAVRLRSQARRRRLRVQARVQLRVARRLHAGRVQPERLRPGQHTRHLPDADPDRGHHLPMASPQHELLSQNFPQYVHLQPLCCHPALWSGDRPET